MKPGCWAVLAVIAAAGCGSGEPAAEGEPAAAATPTAPAAASRAAPATLTGFSHDKALDVFGYYQPVSPIKVGTLQLSHLHVGQLSDLDAWEARGGPEPDIPYGPVMLEFADVTDPAVAHEAVDRDPNTTFRVLPTAYRVDADELRLAGRHERLGEVSFAGKLDSAAVRRAATPEGLPGDTVVLRGTLTAGGQRFENAAFTWYGGD